MADIDPDVRTEPAEPVSAEEEVRICLFHISGDTYAVSVENLAEIIIPQKIFPVPTTPAHVIGVINLRGNIVPVVDIRPVLSLPPQQGISQVAIIRHGPMTLGLAVDLVTEVVSVPKGSILPLPAEASTQEAGAKNRSRYLQAIVQRTDGVVALLNIERTLEAISLS